MNFENDNGVKTQKSSEEDFHFFESVRLVEALLFASAKPLDRASLQSRKGIKPNAIWMQNIDDEGFYDLLIKRLKKFS